MLLRHKKQFNIGKYGLLRLDYLKKHKKALLEDDEDNKESKKK